MLCGATEDSRSQYRPLRIGVVQTWREPLERHTSKRWGLSSGVCCAKISHSLEPSSKTGQFTILFLYFDSILGKKGI